MSNRSGMAVIEVGIPTGYIIVNDVLRSYVQSAEVPTLSRAEFYEQKAVFYLDYVSSGFLFLADVEYLDTHLTYSGRPFFVLPDFLSVQCKFLKIFSVFLINILIFYSIPMPIISILNTKITFHYGFLNPLTSKSENPEISFLLFRIFHLSWMASLPID